MDGGRGFFNPGATRARPVSAGTRLRQKPDGNGAEDFFASLGIDAQSRGRTGSSASSSSNRSFSNTGMNMRPVSASTSSSVGGWRPPPIGGLGSQRPAASTMPPVGSLSIANRSFQATSTTSTMVSDGGASVASPAATSVATAAVTRSKPTQLFSMEDAEELYSEDGWDCDSPSTVLSNPAEELESTSPAEQATGVEAQNEFAWGDDDPFASPVAKPATPPTQLPPLQHHFEAPSVSSMEQSFTSEVSAASAFEAKEESLLPSSTERVSSSAFSEKSFGNAAFEDTNFTANQMPQETHSSFEHATTELSMVSPPSAAVPSMSFSTETQSSFETEAFSSHTQPQVSHPVKASISTNPHHQEEQWNDDWDQQVETEIATLEPTTVPESTVITTTELTSPGAPAGEFWGDGDEDELFDHDDHADEEWDESVREKTAPQQNLEMKSSDFTQLAPAATGLIGHDASFSLDAPPLASVTYPTEAPAKENEMLPVVEAAVGASSYPERAILEEVEASMEESSDQLAEAVQAATEIESSSVPPSFQPVRSSGMEMHSTEDSREAKHGTSLDAGSSPFSSAMTDTSAPDNDPNVFPEAPPSVRFLHTPTGTGGPFGRVPSPQGTEGRTVQDGFSSSEGHIVQHADQNEATFEGDNNNEQSQASETYMESNARWDSSSMHSNHGQMSSEVQRSQHRDDTHHNNRQAQSDEEERDSVVSFSGENSFYPSAGRPSSLYGGSQSSFASHRMYQSSVASTDHEGSSIASFGVSSAGATFGGSERVSEGGAFSDGTVSETPSMVDSSNASTAFGTDFPSVSEGQFSAPGTTIGGSDNASDGGFSDGNASETTSMCESVNTNPRFVSEFSTSTGHYVTETVERRDIQEPFAIPPRDSDSAVAFGESPPTMFGGDDSSVGANPFTSSSSAFPPPQQTTSVSSSSEPSESTFAHQSNAEVQDEGVQSAASLFGATAGADVPNPFSSFGAPPSTPATQTNPIVEHELPTTDAGDLFGSVPPSSGFNNSFAQPTQQSYGSNYQTRDQVYNRAGQEDYSGGQTLQFDSEQRQFGSSSPFDRPAAAISNPNSFEAQNSSNYNKADPFASRGTTQHGYGNTVPSADSVFSGGGGATHGEHNGNVSATPGSQFGENASTDATFGGYSQTETSTTASGQSGVQVNSQLYGTSYGGEQNYNQFAEGSTSAYGGQGSKSISRASDHFRNQSTTSVDANAEATFSAHSYVQSNGAVAGNTIAATSGGTGHFSRQSSTSSFASGYGGQNRGSQQVDQWSVPGTSDNYSRHSTVAQTAQPLHDGQSHYSAQHFDQRSIPGTPNNNSRHSRAGGFGSASSAQPSYRNQQSFTHQSFDRNDPSASGGMIGDHAQTASSASADAFFGQSAMSAASVFGGERSVTPSAGSVAYQHGPPQGHAQPSFSRSGSNASSTMEQQSSQFVPNATPMRSAAQSYDLNTSYGSIEDMGHTRHASNLSMRGYGSEASLQSHQHVQSTPAVDANAYFGQVQAATTQGTASTFFGDTTSQRSSEVQTLQSQGPDDYSIPGVHTTSQFPPPAQQEREDQQQYAHNESSYYKSRDEYVGASVVPPAAQGLEASPPIVTGPPSAEPPVHTSVEATGPFVDSHEVPSSFATENDSSQHQAFNGFDGSGSREFSNETSSEFFSGSRPQGPQASAVAASHFGHNGHGQETYVHESAATSQQFAETHYSHQQPTSVSYGENAALATGATSGRYFDSTASGAGAASPAISYSQQQQQQHSFQQQAQPYNATGHVESQQAGTGYNTAALHGYGTVAGHGHSLVSLKQPTHPAAIPAVKTSNKYKDPCVAPPSCLASFGFGGNVVTMFPKRKLRLNIAGSSYRNSPRGAPVPSEFENSGNGELRKGPVNVYRMDQIHPKDKEFKQMDNFPGPLTEDVSDEVILDYLDERLKRSEAPSTADDVEDENERLLLGVLQVLVKCNGKMRSEPGMLNPSDPNSPEAQLITLLSESSKRRSGNVSPTFPAPRKIQSSPHPELVLKHANDLRELLLVGDRKGAVCTAMSAHMWPEAMLIASFTDKDEYRRVLRTYLEEHYATGDPVRALFMSFADQQEKSIQEPKRLAPKHGDQATDSLILSSWVSHAQVLLVNRTADTNKILMELGDRLWNELNAVAAAHVCYLLAGAQVEAPMPSSKMALLGGDHRTPNEARFYVSPAAVQRTEVYEWAQKHSKGAAANLMIPFQGYKLIYAMILADHGKLETAFKYVTSMLTVIKAVTATMKPGTSMYLEGMKNQLTVLDDRLRQHLGQDRVASVAASTSQGGRKSGKWGFGSALSMMGKIVNRVVEGNDSSSASSATASASTPGGLYAGEATPPAANYPNTPTVVAPTLSPTPYPQQQVQETPPPSSHGPSPVPTGSYSHATPPMSQGSAPGSSIGYNRTPVAPPAGPYSKPAANGISSSGPFSGNGRLHSLQHQQSSSPLSGNGKLVSSGPHSNNGPAFRSHAAVPPMCSHSMEPPGSNHSMHSNSSLSGMPQAPVNNPPQYAQQYEQPPSSQTSQHSQYSQHSHDAPPARPTTPAFHRPTPLDVTGDANITSSLSEPKTLAAELAAEVAASLPPMNLDPSTMSGPLSDKGKASPKFKGMKKPGRSKTPPPSNSSKGPGWLSGLSSFIATKMNPEAKVAKLGEQMEAYYDEQSKRWVFPGETAAEEPSMPSAPPPGPMPGSAPGSISTGIPPSRTNSAPGSLVGGPTPSDDPLAALMAPPPSHVLMKKDPLAAMMAPPSRPGVYGARRGGSTAQRKPPRPQFAVFKPSAAPGPVDQNE